MVINFVYRGGFNTGARGDLPTLDPHREKERGNGEEEGGEEE